MAKTFMQMAEEAMAQAQAISAEDTLQELKRDSNALLVDVRDESEVQGTGMGIGAINAPGRSIAWIADLEFDEQYREPELTNRTISIDGTAPTTRLAISTSNSVGAPNDVPALAASTAASITAGWAWPRTIGPQEQT